MNERLVITRYRRAHVLFVHVALAAVAIIAALASHNHDVIPIVAVLSLISCVVFLQPRIEVDREHVIERGLFLDRTFRLDAVRSLSMHHHDFSPARTVVAHWDKGSVAVHRLDVADAETLVGVLAVPILHRVSAALSVGDSFAFVDPAPFPWWRLGIVAAMLGFIVALFVDPYGTWVGFWMLPPIVVILWTLVAFAAWWESRRNGGVAMSIEGIRPLHQRPDRFNPGRFDAISAAGAGWIPWAALTRYRYDSFGATFELEVSHLALSLTADTENLPVLMHYVEKLAPPYAKRGRA